MDMKFVTSIKDVDWPSVAQKRALWWDFVHKATNLKSSIKEKYFLFI
jgi:hypothetical protein